MDSAINVSRRIKSIAKRVVIEDNDYDIFGLLTIPKTEPTKMPVNADWLEISTPAMKQL